MTRGGITANRRRAARWRGLRARVWLSCVLMAAIPLVTVAAAAPNALRPVPAAAILLAVILVSAWVSARVVRPLHDIERACRRSAFDAQASLRRAFRSVTNSRALTRSLLPVLGDGCGAQAGAFYLMSGGQVLELSAHWGSPWPGALAPRLNVGEGPAGRAAYRRCRSVESIPGAADGSVFVAVPYQLAGRVKGVAVFVRDHAPGAEETDFLDGTAEMIAIALDSRHARERVQLLLGETRRHAAAYAAQQLELQQTNIRLQRSDRYKNEFLANMTHELRSPLNSMLLMSQVLAENRHGHLAGDEVDAALVINKAGRELLVIIDDILDLTKAEAGRLELYPEEVRISDLTASLAALYRPLAARRCLELSIVVDPGTPASCRTDPTRLSQILKNLLNNALKFTEHGSVSLRVSASSEPLDGQPALDFTVTDTGIGISAEVLPELFAPFTQGDGSIARRFGGSGLGLSICRKLSELLGARIGVVSTVDHGSTFTLRLPLTPPVAAGAGVVPGLSADTSGPVISDASQSAAVTALSAVESAGCALPAPVLPVRRPERVHAAEPDGSHSVPRCRDGGTRRLNLLIVDDREANLQSLTQILARDDVRIFTASCGNEALGLMLEHDFALVLLDVQMPGMDGFEVATLMRADERTRHVPVIFVTAISKERHHIFDGYDAGAVDYLFKPLDPHVIRSKVAVFIELKRSQLARQRLLESLSRANAQFEETARIKSDYLAAASHELRTPLTAMKEFCSLVHDEVVGPLNAEQRRCLETALRNCRRLGGVVERLVDLDSLESGRLRVRRERVNVAELVRTGASAVLGRCRAAGQRIEISAPERAEDAEALADAGLVGDVLAQLLDNARKFSPAGGRIRLRVRRLGDRVTVEVGDQGTGIAPLHRRSIFDKYTQVDRRDGPGVQGLGLGLAIATRLLESQDSRLDLLSTPGCGSIFGFSLPVYTESAHLSAFCGDGARQAVRRWDPRCLIMVAGQTGAALPDWLAAAAERLTDGPDGRSAVIPADGRPALAVLVGRHDPGASAWIDRLRQQEPVPGAAACLEWTTIPVDEAGSLEPLAPRPAWIGLVSEEIPQREGAWR